MFGKPKQKMIKFNEKIDFYHKAVIYKTPIISVIDNNQKDTVDFFMAKGDEVAILLSKDLKSIGLAPKANETYFIVNAINTRKSYNVFKLDTELLNFALDR